MSDPAPVTILSSIGNVAATEGSPPFDNCKLLSASTKNIATPSPMNPKQNPPRSEARYNLMTPFMSLWCDTKNEKIVEFRKSCSPNEDQ
jgi:hypothetical protein